MSTNHKIIFGDSRDMSLLKDKSIHLMITSPPYWQLKDYGSSDQIGYDDSYENYINNLNLVWSECDRVLHPGCKICINIGDQFARSVYYGRYKVVPIRTEIIKFLETIGYDYMGAIIWQKVTTTNTTGGATIMGSFPYPRNGILKLDYEFILLFRKLGNPPKVHWEVKEQSKLTIDEWNEYFSGHWNFPGVRQDKHLAMFPEELPRRLIRMFSFTGETVLDPFLGSGTTSLAAKNLARNSVGYEINKDFEEVIKKKLGVLDELDLESADITFSRQSEMNNDFQDRITKFKYIFHDPVKFDKKIDPKKLQFGSKIDNDSVSDNYYSIKEVLSPERLVLNTGLHVRLIGVKAKDDKKFQAMEYLINEYKGQRVFLKFDEDKYDENGNLLCYLYLKNKTFINAHLIKNNLVEIDLNSKFRFKDKFLEYSRIG